MKKLAIFAAVLAAVGYAMRGECKNACGAWCNKDRPGKDTSGKDVANRNAPTANTEGAFSPDSNAPI